MGEFCKADSVFRRVGICPLVFVCKTQKSVCFDCFHGIPLRVWYCVICHTVAVCNLDPRERYHGVCRFGIGGDTGHGSLSPRMAFVLGNRDPFCKSVYFCLCGRLFFSKGSYFILNFETIKNRSRSLFFERDLSVCFFTLIPGSMPLPRRSIPTGTGCPRWW